MQEKLYDYAVIGGDMRQVYLTEELADPSRRICYYALSASPKEGHCSPTAYLTNAATLQEACNVSSQLICPIPLSTDGTHLNQRVLTDGLTLQQLLDELHAGQLFLPELFPLPLGMRQKRRG